MGNSNSKQTQEEGEERIMSDETRNQIKDIIEGEIQLGINDYLEEKQEKEKNQGLGFVTPESSEKNSKSKSSKTKLTKS